MSDITIKIFVRGPDGRFLSAADVEKEPALVAAPKYRFAANPPGGLTITDDIELLQVEDSLGDAADFFLYTLPQELKARRGATYSFRTGPETTVVDCEGDVAVVTGYDGTRLAVPADALAAALEAALPQYEALYRLLSS